MQGKYGKSGKWGKGKGKGTKSKGYYGGKCYNGYRSPGKAIGKSLNYWGEDGYIAAWGSEADIYYYKYDDWDYSYGDMNHVGNHMMLLEHINITTGGKKHSHEPRDESITTTTHSHRHI